MAVRVRQVRLCGIEATQLAKELIHVVSTIR